MGITTIIGDSTFTDYNRCQPTLYINDVVSELMPGWIDCKPVSYGVWDPPRTLTPVGQLVPTTEAPAPSATPDPPPPKTSVSEAAVSSDSSLDASPGPSPGPSPESSLGHTSSASPDPTPDPSPDFSPDLSPNSSPDDLPKASADPSPSPSPGPAPASSPDLKQPVPTAQPAGKAQTGSLVPSAVLVNPARSTSTPSATPSDPSEPKQVMSASKFLSKKPAVSGPDTNDPNRPALTFYTQQTDVAAMVTIGSATIPITILPAGAGVIISAHTLAPNDPAVTIVADIPISLALASHSDPAGSARLNLIVDSSTIDLAPPASSPISTDPAADALLHQSPLPGISPVPELTTLTLVSGGSTLKVIQVAAHTIRLVSGALLPTGTHTATAGAMPPNGDITARESTATAVHASIVTISGAIITAGAPAITIAGQLVSLGANGLLAVGTNAENLPTASFTIYQGPVVTVGGQIATAINPSKVIVGGEIVSAGGSAITIASQLVSLGTNGLLVVGTNTANVPTTLSTIDQDPVITVGGQIATVINPSEAIIDGKIISAGGPVLTLANGEVASAAGTDALVVMNASVTRTEKFARHASSTLKLGGFILGAFGGSIPGVPGAGSETGARPTGSTYNGSAVTSFTGAAIRQATESITYLMAVMVLAMLWPTLG